MSKAKRYIITKKELFDFSLNVAIHVREYKWNESFIEKLFKELKLEKLKEERKQGALEVLKALEDLCEKYNKDKYNTMRQDNIEIFIDEQLNKKKVML